MPFIRRDLLLVAGSCSVCWRLLTLIALSLGDSEDVAAGIFERSRACLSMAAPLADSARARSVQRGDRGLHK